MEQLNQFSEIDVGTMKTFSVKSNKKVSELLKELKLSNKFFAILINGKRAGLDDVIKASDSVVLLPRIAGGF